MCWNAFSVNSFVTNVCGRHWKSQIDDADLHSAQKHQESTVILTSLIQLCAGASSSVLTSTNIWWYALETKYSRGWLKCHSLCIYAVTKPKTNKTFPPHDVAMGNTNWSLKWTHISYTTINIRLIVEEMFSVEFSLQATEVFANPTHAQKTIKINKYRTNKTIVKTSRFHKLWVNIN